MKKESTVIIIMSEMKTVKIKVWGIVQGVGFRPFVAKLADRYEMKGEVLNIGGLVETLLTDTHNRIQIFLEALRREKPLPAEIVHIRSEEVEYRDFSGFTILNSDEGDDEAAMEYIRQTQIDIDGIVPVRYCENNTINLILSAFVKKANQRGVTLDIDVVLPDVLVISDTEICTLLSNGLENAVEAAAKKPDSAPGSDPVSNPGSVRLNCRIHKGNLLILIENTFHGKIEMKNGLPQTNKEGHGFGTKSIAMLAEKYKGYHSFTAKEGLFILKIVLPMEAAGKGDPSHLHIKRSETL